MDPLTLLLMFLFVIIVFNVVSEKMPSEMIVGSASLMFVMLWISWDNLGAWENSPMNNKTQNILKVCGLKRENPRLEKIKKKIKFAEKDEIIPNTEEDSDSDDEQGSTSGDKPKSNSSENPTLKQKPILKQKPVQEQKPDLKQKPTPSEGPKKEGLLPASARVKPYEYSENNYKKNNFPELGCIGDNKLMVQMKKMSNLNREAMDGAARFDKYTNINYFQNELDQAANSRWWDNQELEKEF